MALLTSDLENLPDDSSDDDDGDSDDRPRGASASTIITFKKRGLGESSNLAPTYSRLVNVSSVEISAASVSSDTVVSLPLVPVSTPSLSAAVSVTGFSSLGSGIPVFLSGVSTAPLFSTFPSLAGLGNLFATSVGISSSTVPPVFTTLPPGSSSGSVHPRGDHPASPR
ncbi:hypothetical protein Hanom_Chr07g00636201 [Helianthus anomalus]